MADGEKKVSCVLCNRSEETKITGPLSTQDEVTAHQNCLVNIGTDFFDSLLTVCELVG